MLMTRPGQSSWNNKNKRKHLHVCIRIDIVDFLKTKSKIRKIKEVKFESSIIVIFCTETITQTIETFGFFSKAYSIHRYRHTFMHTLSSLQSFLCGNRDERLSLELLVSDFNDWRADQLGDVFISPVPRDRLRQASTSISLQMSSRGI